jgi:ribosomal protein S14
MLARQCLRLNARAVPGRVTLRRWTDATHAAHRDAVDGRNRSIAGNPRIFDLIHQHRL